MEKPLLIKDLLLFYGCKCYVEKSDNVISGGVYNITSKIEYGKTFLINIDNLWILNKSNKDARNPFIVRPILRSVLSITNEEIIEVANMALGYGNQKMENPSVYRYNDDGINCIAVVENSEEEIDSYYQLSKLNYDWIEMDSSFTVRVVHNTLCGMNEITKYLISKQFDIFGWIKEGLALDKDKI